MSKVCEVALSAGEPVEVYCCEAAVGNAVYFFTSLVGLF